MRYKIIISKILNKNNKIFPIFPEYLYQIMLLIPIKHQITRYPNNITLYSTCNIFIINIAN